MKVFWGSVFLLLLCASVKAQMRNLVTYAGNSGNERFYSVIQLSDSTYLVSGTADNLKWLPAGTTTISMSGTSGIHNNFAVIKKTGFLLHLKPDLKTIINVLYLPSGTAQDIRHINVSNAPGSSTGSIYISGTTIDSRGNAGGYFIARLNNNYVSGTPSGLTWAYNVYATGYYSSEQPWDVGNDGRVIFVAGQPYGTDSCAVLKLKADGSGPDIVDQWRTHYGINISTGTNTGGEWSPASANPNVSVNFSALLMKNISTCELRSWNKADYKATLNDENGATKNGTWPMDVFFSSACDTSLPNKTLSNPGYTGYSIGSSRTSRVGAIVVDRRDNSFYIGVSSECYLPSGLPDEEPFVLAFTKDGTLKWWDRLHKESALNSPPPQEISGMAIDYSQTGTMAAVVVLASVWGDGSNNLWQGTSIVNNPLSPGYAFHNKYTGTDTTVKIAWLGRLRISNGDLLNSTYIAGYLSTDPLTQTKYSEPIHDNWASHNAGNPGLAETDPEIDVQTDDFGRIYILAVSTRIVTTSNAYQKMVKPSASAPGSDAFLRVFEPDLTRLVYCSALTGKWNNSTGAGGANTTLKGVYPTFNGAIIVGYHHDDNGDLVSDGNSIPLSHVPAWGDSTPKAEEAILARLIYDTVLKAYFKVSPKTGACTNTNVTFTDSSYGATGWSWDFGPGASPATATGKGPHTVKYSSPDTVQVKLVVSNGTQKDSMTIPYIISAAPSSSFTYSGTITSVPATLTFTGPAGTGISYSWDFGDPSSGGDDVSALANPVHIYYFPGTYTVKLTVTSGNCSSTTTKSITITGGIGAADATFTISANPGCLGIPETFTQTNLTNTESWYWQFGDGAVPQISTKPGPQTVNYVSPGVKTAFLTVSNGLVKQTKALSFVINSLPNSSFTWTGSTSTIPTSLIFSSNCSGCTYYWDFGDTGTVDNISTKQQTVHKYNSDGTYLVTCKVSDPAGTGCASTSYQFVTISGSVQKIYYSDFTIAPTRSTCVNNKVFITDMSYMPDKSRTWYFGKDAVPAMASNTDTVTVYWTSAGTKTVELIAGAASGFDVEKTKSVFYEVTDYPDATFTFTGNTGTAPATVSFSANESNGYLYAWDFGDSSSSSNTSNNSKPTHKYSSTGIYTVTLAITHNGCTSYFARNIYIGFAEPAIVPAFTVNPSKNGCQSPVVIITNLSTGIITSYAWQFGTGASPSTASTTGPHTVSYASNGNKTLKLTIGNGTISETAKMKIKISY
jgi:PKD repeat protein